MFQSTAQGSYCLISVKVGNVGKQAQSFSGSDQKALDAKGVQRRGGCPVSSIRPWMIDFTRRWG
jgi:hypothetical protein